MMPWIVGIPFAAWAGAKVVEILSDDPDVKKTAQKVQEVSKVALSVILVFVPSAPKAPIPKKL